MERYIRIRGFKLGFGAILIILSQNAFAQVPAFDRMEQLYDQGHYGMVYRRSVRCLNNPEYDYSLLPKFYKSLAVLQRLQKDNFRASHEREIKESFEFIEKLASTFKGKEIVRTHGNEIEALQLDLNAWLENERSLGNQKTVEFFSVLIKKSFPKAAYKGDQEVSWNASNRMELKKQESMIAFAEKLKGTTYVWGGMTQEGFDCSGFTSYVFKEFGITLPRVSADQYAQSIKISSEDAHIGDLVFFGREGKVTHVGILVNQPGEPKKMIHASSSKGVVFQEIDGSNYFSSRLIGFGRY
jgi:peptidoglycan DL-endopeptidase CwlO